MNYGKTLKYLRESMKLSQTKIADILNIAHSQYSHYEVEDRTIPLEHLISLCSFYKVSIDYMFRFKNNPINLYSNPNINLKLSGSRIKDIRKNAKLTQTKFGDKLGCSYGTISGYEKGRYLISTTILYDICKTYKISADYILGKVDSPKYLK